MTAISESESKSNRSTVPSQSSVEDKMPQQKVVSFRSDVALRPTHRSLANSIGSASSGGHNGDSGSINSASSTTSSKYSKLRSNLTRENSTEKDPMYFYQVTRCLGSGSMGDVKLVKKRFIGGSARRDMQEAIQRQRLEKKCLEMPYIGGVFQMCLDGDLKETTGDGDAWSSRHSVLSFLGGKEDATVPTKSRSFEDSLLQTKEGDGDGEDADLGSGMIYAMKSLILEQVGDPIMIDELRNEIAILKDLDHPNIVRAMETFEFRGEISIIMEVCSGGDLYARDPYKEGDAARIVTCVLRAIAYMHSRQVIHRDLKYENILFANTSPMSEVKLIDFGLSRVYQNSTTKLTQVAGTIYTMAPEVIMGKYNEQADMWSIGVVTFMLLTSALPFYGKTRDDIVKRIIRNKYSFSGRRWKHISQEARNFITSLLVLDTEKRATAPDALASNWLQRLDGQTNSLASVQDLAKTSIFKYAGYPRLKKMALMVVAHKSSTHEIGVLRKLFEKYTSHDGVIRMEDFESMMSDDTLATQDLNDVFEAMDLDGSGKIRYTAFIAATIEAHGAISEARLAEAFDRLDADDSGAITAEDLEAILGEDTSPDEINEIIAEVDTTNSGRVFYSEFMALFEQQHEEDLQNQENPKAIASELSSISVETDASEGSDARAEFLKEKHLQSTLRTWALEMQLPAQEFSHGCSFLHQVALGDEAILQKALEERPKLVNFRDYDRRTALHIAASEGLVNSCRFLIKRGARINRSDRWGGFPLDDAHRHRHTDVVNLLREHGAKFGSTSKTVNLITAASEGNIDEVKTLLEFGSMDLNQGDYDHRTALHLAANEGHLEIVQLLCDAGADINVKDRWGEQPLDDARKAKKNASAIISILSGVSIETIADQPVATMDNLKDQSVKQTQGPSQEEKKDDGMTPLSAQEFAMGCSFLHQAAIGNKLVLEKILLERPELVKFRDYDRRTALHIAASEGNLEICQYLVEQGAMINRVDRWGGSPLDDAHRDRHAEIVKFLRDQGAKFGSTSQLSNFITAASEGDVEEVRAFLDFGSVDLNQGDYDARTAMHLSAGEGHLEIVRMLCEAGADVNVEDRWRNRPLDEARRAKTDSTDIVRVLLKHGAKSKRVFTTISTAFSVMISPR